MGSDVDARRELQTRLERANARIQSLEVEVEAAPNVVRFRTTRHVQSLKELAADLDRRSLEIPPEHTDERLQFERDLGVLEHETAFAEAKLEAARAEERGDEHGEAHADVVAAAAQSSAIRDELGDPRTGHGSGRATEEGDDMATDIYTLIAATYAVEDDAIADYEDVRATYSDPDIRDMFDAAVLSRDNEGKVHIVKRAEEPTRHGAAAGLVGGLAVGALVALFPAIAIGPGLAIGGAGGTAIGATAGHVARGMTRGDLKDLGEHLDRSESGLVVITDPEREAAVEGAIKRAKDVVKKQVEFDAGGLRSDIESF
jgi:uncharacterized membrane protein